MRLPEDQFAVVDGLRVRYWLEGDGGPHLVLIHGIGGAIDVWRRQFDPLSRTHWVLALDLPGCGRSEVLREYPPDTLRILATTVRGLMRLAGIEQATIVGSSLGGAVAIEFAVRWPDATTSLVLVGPAGMTHHVAWSLRLMAVPVLGEWLTTTDRSRTAQAIRTCVADPAMVEEDDIDRAFAMAHLPGAQNAFLRLLRVYAGGCGLNRREIRRLQSAMQSVRAPALIIWGELDRVLPVSAATYALEHLADAALIVRPLSGHLVFVEEPVWFNQVVAEFSRSPGEVLARVRAGRKSERSAPAAQGWSERLRGLAVAPALPEWLTPRRVAAASAGLLLIFAVQYARQRE